MQAPQEMEFLQSAGLGPAQIMLFGLLQVAGAVLLVPKKTRFAGALLAAAAFAVSAVLIFLQGNMAFGLISLLPVALAGLIAYQAAKPKENNS